MFVLLLEDAIVLLIMLGLARVLVFVICLNGSLRRRMDIYLCC